MKISVRLRGNDGIMSLCTCAGGFETRPYTPKFIADYQRII